MRKEKLMDDNCELRKIESDKEKIERYEKLLFKLGEMNRPPCFKCGYNGKGYYQPNIHKCSELHHKYYKCNSDE